MMDLIKQGKANYVIVKDLSTLDVSTLEQDATFATSFLLMAFGSTLL